MHRALKTPGEGGPHWQEIRTDHFIIDTDLPAEEATAEATQLENKRSVLVRAFFRRQPRPQQSLRILALRGEEYGEFDQKSIGSYVRTALFQPLLVTQVGHGVFSSDID